MFYSFFLINLELTNVKGKKKRSVSW